MKKGNNTSAHLSMHYDSKIRSTIPYYDSFHQEIINLIESMNIEPEIWLDTGCGTGTFAKKALDSFPRTHFLLADPSRGMLIKARRKLDAYWDRITFLKPISSQEISLEQKIDVITAIQSHHYMSKEERYKATDSCFNLLNENGVFVTFENIKPLTEKGIQIGKEYWKNFQISEGREIKEVENHLNRFNVEYFPITIEEHISLLKNSGFSVVEMFWYSYMQAGFYCLNFADL
ncbi:MAG: class I SAM-dependent methyltransferase [Methanobacterium sp.]